MQEWALELAWRCATAGLVVLAWAGTAQAQEQAQEQAAEGERPTELGTQVEDVSLGGTRVRLSRLLEHAATHAPALMVARAEVDLADADFGRADPLLPGNPTLLAGFGPRLGANGGSDPNALVQLLQELEVAGQRPQRFEVARAARARRRRSLEGVRWQVHQQLHAAYHRALAARRRVEIARRLAGFGVQLVEVARRRVQTGDASPLILRLAEADAAQARQREVAALQVYRDACLSLAEVAGWGARSLPEPVGVLPAPRRAPPLAALTELAAAHNPALLLRRAAVEEAEARVDLADREAWPNPSIGVRYIFEGAPTGGPQEHVVMGLLRVPIPSFALNQEARARSSAEREVAEARHDALRSVLEVRLERLRTAVNAAAERVQSYGDDILPRFEENLQLLRRAFELGEIDLLRVSVAVERFLSVQQQALNAQVDYFATVAALEMQVGEEIWADEEHHRRRR